MLKSKPTKQSVLNYHKTWWGRLNFYGFLILMYCPLIILIVYSFNNSKRNVVWRGFTTKYWEKMWNNHNIWDAVGNSFTLAFFTMIFSTILAVLAAYGLERFRFRLRSLYDATLSVPLVVPEISLAIMLMMFFVKLDLPIDWVFPFNLTTLVIAHTSFCFPFATLIIRARLANFDKSLEEAAKDMGASNWQVLCHIVIPYLKPAIISSGLLSFIFSLDDFVVTFFVASPNTPTFPLYVFSSVKMGVTPAINAISTLIVIFTVFVLAVAMWYQGKSKQDMSNL